jgi:hypothetical protein
MKNLIFTLAIVYLALSCVALAKPTANRNKEKQLLDQLLALKQEGSEDENPGKIILQQDDNGRIIVKQAANQDEDDDNGIVLEQEDEDDKDGEGGALLSKLDLKALEKIAEKDAKSQYYHRRYYYHGHYYYHPYHVVHVHHHYHHYGK